MNESIQVVPTGFLQVNTCLVQNPGSDILYVIDPGDDIANVVRAAQNFQYKTVRILLTHAHVDHIHSLAQAFRDLHAEAVYLNPADLPIYNNPGNSIEPYIPAAENLPETSWPLEDDRVRVIACPGHSPGGSTYVFPELNTAFTGDTLFRQSVGRTDFAGGSAESLRASVRYLLKTLPDTMRLIPGHEEDTTVAFEKRFNPFR